jgi:hypothetical protein
MAGLGMNLPSSSKVPNPAIARKSVRAPRAVAVPESPLIIISGQRGHSLTDTGRDVLSSMEGWANKELPRYLKPVDKCWQPSDFLPESSSPDFYDQVWEWVS